MRILLLNGADVDERDLRDLVDREEADLSSLGLDVERFDLAHVPLHPCEGCFDCWVKTPGVCKRSDGANRITRAYATSDVVVIASRISFGGWGPNVKKAQDRMIGLVSPFFERFGAETRHRKRYARYPAILALGVLSEWDADEAALFREIVDRNAASFHAPAHTCLVIRRGDEAGFRITADVLALGRAMREAA